VSKLLRCSLQATYLFDELTYHFEASNDWVSLPEAVVSQIENGSWDEEIAELINQGLIEVEIPEDFWARINGKPVGLAA
jgi:hypothetical protein